MLLISQEEHPAVLFDLTSEVLTGFWSGSIWVGWCRSGNHVSDLSSGPDQSPDVEEVLSGLQADLLVPYSQVLLNCPAELPDCCLSFGIKTGQNRWFIFSEAEEVRQARTELNGLLQVRDGAEVQFKC